MDKLLQEIGYLEAQTNQPDFWEKEENAKVLEQISLLKNKEKLLQELQAQINTDYQTDQHRLEIVKNLLKKVIFKYCFSAEKYLDSPVIVNIYSGVGGRDAEDWVGILARLYQKFFASQRFSFKMIAGEPNDVGGYKFISYEVSGTQIIMDSDTDKHRYPYGILKFEKGVHRLVRISPFSAGKLRHTSFALVEIIPLLPETSLQFKESDLEVQTFRSGGAGGQNVNKVETAVRIIYRPLDLSVVCQSERQQQQNKRKALQILTSKIIKTMEEKKVQELQNLKGAKIDIGWGYQKRSYVFHPYQLVKDHEFGYETNKLNDILDGRLELIHPLGAIL